MIQTYAVDTGARFREFQRVFSIVAENSSPANVYIAKAMENGKPYRRSWFAHLQLMAGGEVTLII
jgi:putative alpha-1,2-mannosidase